MTYPTDRRYSKDHEWIRLEDDGRGLVGITDYAQAQLGDVVFVELPEVGRVLQTGEQNTALVDQPDQVNADPHGTWMLRLELPRPDEVDALLDAAGYDALVT